MTLLAKLWSFIRAIGFFSAHLLSAIIIGVSFFWFFVCFVQCILRIRRMAILCGFRGIYWIFLRNGDVCMRWFKMFWVQ